MTGLSSESGGHLSRLLAAGRHSEALASARARLSASPLDGEALAIAGAALLRLQQLQDADVMLHRALAVCGANAWLYVQLGILYASTHRHDQAETWFRSAVTLNPGNPDAPHNLGVLMLELGRLGAAREALEAAQRLNPDHAPTLFNLGLLEARSERFAEAEQCFRRAIRLQPSFALAHFNLATALVHRGRARDAERAFHDALRCDPQHLASLRSLATLLADRGADAEAERHLRQALKIVPDELAIRFDLGSLLLRQGRYVDGWPYYESRESPMPAPVITHRTDARLWQGEPLAGQSLLVVCDQGYGDQIQFARYLPGLKERGAGRLSLIGPAVLAPLLSTIEGVDEFIPAEAEGHQGLYERWCFLGSLPLRFGTTLASIPAKVPYLTPDPERLRQWAPRLPGAGFRVGLVWKGSALHRNDRFRSLPHFDTLKPLLGIPGLSLVSLQKGQAETEMRGHQGVADLGTQMLDFGDAAALLAQLDLLITVDTAMAHLAGAIGTPCWVLLPARNTDWRWLREREDTPWYPNSLRLFRQQRFEDWGAVVGRVVAALNLHQP
ncbi:MAG: hypothetical protein JWQ90_2889 [Hydrocarboniphaga sp.]|uniref:tetratricopeptide repeat protein n=1 Tax=Hydrocarboniphaga sp. TaxID=2033016 RepID=UPI00260364CD|nr:tetratricopeptide repeat protein [Hydrocarboniphaga sp.]MDB5970439.1 hypothetical protein [Hydrocarboniphaga sp.]